MDRPDAGAGFGWCWSRLEALLEGDADQTVGALREAAGRIRVNTRPGTTPSAGGAVISPPPTTGAVNRHH